MNRLEGLYTAHVEALGRCYEQALASTGYDAVVVHAGSPRKRTDADDQYWPLRATPHFQHWAPVAEPDASVVVRPGRRPILVRVRTQSFWEKPAIPEREHDAGSFDHAWLDAPEDLKGVLPRSLGRVAYIGDDGARAVSWGIAADGVCPENVLRALEPLRVHKSPYEIACIAEANRRAAVGHIAVRDAFKAGADTELDLHLAYLRATRQDDWETPYKNIVAMGPHAATLHHVSYGKRSAPGDSAKGEALLLDAGVTFEGYCADITRTWVRGHGAAVDVFRALVTAMDTMQQTLCARVQVGRPYEQLHDEAHERLGAVLVEHGIVTVSPSEAVAHGITRTFLPHGLGHSLGLQCHDVGCAVVRPRADNPYLRNTSVISVGQVLTIEPGVYFIPALLAPLREGPHAASVHWPLVDALAVYGGVRIEDDVVVRPEGADNLTRPHLPVGGGAP